MFQRRKLAATALCVAGMMLAGARIARGFSIAGPVKTMSGPVTGTTVKDGSVQAFLGIPYAAPPVGDLRWKAPQPVTAWRIPLHADSFGASCMQELQRSRLPWTKEYMAQNQDSEDCLTLNVWTPSTPPASGLPVFVWIHGGGFTEGSSEVPVYDGAELARTGMVVVTINYRLGIFGFFAYPELTAESSHHSSGNYGLLDQVAALKWVHDNIREFGGNPEDVTVCGQSAGAASVHALAATPLARGLFQRAIAQSGSGIVGFPQSTLAEGEKNGVKFAAMRGASSLAELRALPADDLMPRKNEAHSNVSRFLPVVDGWVLPEDPAVLLAQGKQNDVPFLTGLMANDSGSFSGPPLSAEAFRKQVAERYGPMAEDFLKLYPADSEAVAIQSQIQSAQDRGKVSMYLWALRRAKTSRTPTYTYFFTRALPDPEHPEFGAFHSGEIPYEFRNLSIFNRPFQPVDFKISDTMSTYWRRFAKSGNPNGEGLPLWSPVSRESARTMEIGEHTGEVPVASAERLRFWKAYFSSDLSKHAPLF